MTLEAYALEGRFLAVVDGHVVVIPPGLSDRVGQAAWFKTPVTLRQKVPGALANGRLFAGPLLTQAVAQSLRDDPNRVLVSSHAELSEMEATRDRIRPTGPEGFFARKRAEKDAAAAARANTPGLPGKTAKAPKDPGIRILTLNDQGELVAAEPAGAPAAPVPAAVNRAQERLAALRAAKYAEALAAYEAAVDAAFEAGDEAELTRLAEQGPPSPE